MHTLVEAHNSLTVVGFSSKTQSSGILHFAKIVTTTTEPVWCQSNLASVCVCVCVCVCLSKVMYIHVHTDLSCWNYLATDSNCSVYNDHTGLGEGKREPGTDCLSIRYFYMNLCNKSTYVLMPRWG